MDYRVGYHLEHKLRSRKLVAWGTGYNAIEVLAKMEGIKPAFFVSRDYEKLPYFQGFPVKAKDTITREEHYVIIATAAYRREIAMELKNMGFVIGDDYYDWFKTTLPYDCYYGNVPIGKNSYHPWTKDTIDKWVKEIGRFVSVNTSAQIDVNHSLEAISTALFDDIIVDEAYSLLAYGPPMDGVSIGNDVWIGANAFINASKVKTIGNGAIIGTGAVVLDDIPAYAVVVGAPAKVKKYRFTPEQIEVLERVKWWDWDNESINRNAKYIYNPELFFERFANMSIPD